MLLRDPPHRATPHVGMGNLGVQRKPRKKGKMNTGSGGTDNQNVIAC